MRHEDVLEIFATRLDDDPVRFARDLAAAGRYAFIAKADDGEPVAAFGAALLWPGVAAVWAFGTPRWREVALGVTKFIKRTMVQDLREQGVHRAECRVLRGREETARWLELLGARREAVLAGLGRQREDFVSFVWTAPDAAPTH